MDRLFYISFYEGEEFVGVSIVRAPDKAQAIKDMVARECHPFGSDVAMIEISVIELSESANVPDEFVNRFMLRGDIERFNLVMERRLN